MMKKTLLMFFIVLCFSLLLFSEGSCQQLLKLSNSFIDPPSSPLVVYGVIFPEAVIYQSGNMYVPIESFLEILGVSYNLQGLPGRLIINGKDAPISLIAVGPDRNTGQSVYYLNVKNTIDFLGLYCRIGNNGGKVRFSVEEYRSQSVSENASSSISGNVVWSYFEGGSVTLLNKYLNSARIPKVDVISEQYLPGDGYYSFSVIPGQYTVEAHCYYTVQGPVIFDNCSRRYYRILTTYHILWSKSVKVDGGTNITLNFLPGEAAVRAEDKWVYLGVPVQ